MRRGNNITMAMVINAETGSDISRPRYTDIFSSIPEDVFITAYIWVKNIVVFED